MLQGTQTQVESSSIFVISSSVLYCFQRNRNNHLYKHTYINLPDTQVNQCLLSSLTANQPVTGQTPQAPGKENMLFFGASLNFTAYKTRPHGAHPTHGEIKAPPLSLETNSYLSTPAETEVRIHEQAPKVQAHWFSRFLTQTSTHVQAITARLLLLIIHKESLKRSSRRESFSPQSLIPQPLKTQQTSEISLRMREVAPCQCWTVSQAGILMSPEPGNSVS